VKIRGVCYDVGCVYGPRVLNINTRPVFYAAVTHRELEIIRSDLHCNAVRIRGSDIGRLMTATQDALEQGLEVLLSPERWEKSPRETLGYIVAAATAAEQLRERWPQRLLFSVASEATLFVRGIVPGKTITERLAQLRRDFRSGRYDEPFRAFLGEANEAVRRVFHGPVTYAALPFEPVDWSLFDIVGVDHYRESRVKDRYEETLRRFLSHGKPVIITEFGMRGYTGAESSGALGFGVLDNKSLVLHHLPVVGRLVRPRLNGQYVRDEALQARELTETLEILDAAGVEGAFVFSFDEPLSTFSENPRYDLDMSALSLVKTYAGRRGTTYPDMTWEPKAAFTAVAEFYASHQAGRATAGPV
jgi:hypothetical protein